MERLENYRGGNDSLSVKAEPCSSLEEGEEKRGREGRCVICGRVINVDGVPPEGVRHTNGAWLCSRCLERADEVERKTKEEEEERGV